jgi:hypothetical protein
MMRCWEVEPTSENIVKDILQFPYTIDTIIEAQGCVVPDLFLKSGRRGAETYPKQRGDGNCKNKPVAKQRKDTLRMKPMHPDCTVAYERLMENNLNNVADFESASEASSEASELDIFEGLELEFEAVL